MRRDLRPLRDKLRADKRCARLLTLFHELPMYQLDADSLIKEIEQIHKARAVRFLTQSSPRFIEAVVDASLMDQANRSRLAEISMACYKAESTLNDALVPLKSYLLMTYSADFSGVRTKEERLQIINMALAPFTRFLDRITKTKTLASMVIDDVDKAHWTLRGHIEAMKLKSGRGEQTI
jgi:hypothetical protein